MLIFSTQDMIASPWIHIWKIVKSVVYYQRWQTKGGGAGQSRNVVQTKIGKAESDRESGGKNRDRGIKKKEHETKTETWGHRQEQAVLPSST